MTTMQLPAFVAVDWGTTRMRAALVDRNGHVLDRAASEDGVQSVPAGGYEAALEAACSAWFAAHPDLPVLMSGMVGSRNGWIEVPYVSPPCGADDLGRSLQRVAAAARRVFIVPGVDCRSEDGSYDVMRGEEVQAFGSGLRDGLVCLPGTHSKWVEMVDGRIRRFATFATGELYAALTQSFVGRLAEAPDDADAGAAVGETVARLPGGLSRQVFQARAQVLAGTMSGHAVRPFLSALLIEAEAAGARAMFGAAGAVTLVAGEPQLGPYERILARHGFSVVSVTPEAATLSGLKLLAASAGDFGLEQLR
ncbi:2-dehydro-3-deoxygalactonokinase [Lichenihabitans sp. Uapishka_5]|uniref:2-dehydro-3-deoxygalactonokinase n=1 Tax=Lichenihabitans sp. Uapishka_5 TaxID=3037302 RepID=UPI0029E7D375|nr:2-dehydro-3-deoxygalactonokinase [Lichenihabitans sp. Uapishka_5]MDX7951158.1 2-dehydro-3-deoxygalactonokinase [Lichenihabitans sp. Uapishka_5]